MQKSEAEESTMTPWRRRLLYSLPFITFIVIAWFLLKGLSNDPEYLPSARIGKVIPPFSLPSLAEPDRMLTNADLKGAPALLNIWASWCPSCRVEHPELHRIASEEGVPIYGLNYRDDLDDARTYLQKLGDPYRLNIVDQEGRLAFDLGVYGAPETYVLDGNGVVHHRLVGVVDREKWVQELKPVLDRLKGSAVD